MNNEKDRIIILSGGMDSTVLLYRYRKSIKAAFHFQYGQKHHKEVSYAKKNCDKLNIPLHIIDIKNIGGFLKSNLLESGGKIPEGHYEDISMKKTVIPFRNGIMLSITCGIAASNNCKQVLIGNHFGDHIIYPDCSEEFIYAMHEAMVSGTYENVGIFAPFTKIKKRDVALIGKGLGINFKDDTWSCYKGGEIHCGICGTCVERKEALEGFDGTKYEE